MSKPSKTGRRANAAHAAQQVIKQEDDGHRYLVVNAETQAVVYGGGAGVVKGEAIRLASGLVAPSTIREVAAV